MSKRTIILIIALLIVTVGLLAIALAPKKSNVPKDTDVASRPAPSYAHTTMKINTPAKSASGVSSAIVSIDSGGDNISGVQLELSFDKTKLQIVDVVPGAFFPAPTELINKIDNVNGTVSYALIAGIGKAGAKGAGEVATITFREIGKAGEIAAINFEPKSLVTSSETDQSVLKTATSTTFTISSSQTTNSAPPVLSPAAGQ
ncbi:MAG: cohesin domain-containing protein [Patescibacteria group bacterium]